MKVEPTRVRFVYREIRGEEQRSDKRDSKTFDIKMLFESVASGDVTRLDGLHQYLKQNMMKLSDLLCECERAHRAVVSRIPSLTLVLTSSMWVYTCRSVLR